VTYHFCVSYKAQQCEFSLRADLPARPRQIFQWNGKEHDHADEKLEKDKLALRIKNYLKSYHEFILENGMKSREIFEKYVLFPEKRFYIL